MSKIIRIWKKEVHYYSLRAGGQTMLPKSLSGECELTDVELEAACGAYNYGSAPVSPTCLQSILLGNGNCGTQSLGEDHFSGTQGLSENQFAATSNTNLGRSQ